MKTFFAVLTLAAVSTTMHAALTVPAGPWQQIVSPVTQAGEKITSAVNNTPNSNAYWNNVTDDSGPGTTGACMNIGCLVTGANATVVAATPAGALLGAANGWGAPVWLGNNDGSAISNISFSAIPTPPSADLLVELAGAKASNWVGWYQTDYTAFLAADKGTKWNVLFDGASSAGASAVFTPTLNFGLWFLPNFSLGPQTDAAIATALNTQADRRFTQAGNNGVAAGGGQYFTVFAKSAAAVNTLPVKFVVGVEDTVYGSGDGDGNDLVLSFTAVPEPGYYAVLSLGLLALGVARRRMKTTVN